MAKKKIEDEVVENVVDEASLHEEGDATEAAQTLQPGSQPDQSKTAMMANAMQMMAGMLHSHRLAMKLT